MQSKCVLCKQITIIRFSPSDIYSMYILYVPLLVFREKSSFDKTSMYNESNPSLSGAYCILTNISILLLIMIAESFQENYIDWAYLERNHWENLMTSKQFENTVAIMVMHPHVSCLLLRYIKRDSTIEQHKGYNDFRLAKFPSLKHDWLRSLN